VKSLSREALKGFQGPKKSTHSDIDRGKHTMEIKNGT